MAVRTTPAQRQAFYAQHQRGATYQQLAEQAGLSKQCVRYWCRRQRDGGSCHTTYSHPLPGLLSRFPRRVRYALLRLRLQHPHWGPNRIRAHLRQRSALQGLPLPSDASIGRYLHQWPRFRRPKPKLPRRVRPTQPTAVGQRWQIDFKLGIALRDGTLVNLHTLRDPLGEVCLGAFVFAAGRVGHPPSNVTFEQVRTVLRQCFARWSMLPSQVQTDGETTLIGRPGDPFPSRFTLWLKGLGIDHLVIRPGTPPDNAEVERCHRTINDYAIIGNEAASLSELQLLLDQAVHELAFELVSQAQGCRGRPPVVAPPELLRPRRPFQAEQELACFDLQRVDASGHDELGAAGGQHGADYAWRAPSALWGRAPLRWAADSGAICSAPAPVRVLRSERRRA
jgi:transposase InsO family protein